MKDYIKIFLLLQIMTYITLTISIVALIIAIKAYNTSKK